MKEKFTGIKLNFNTENGEPEVIRGEKVLPHRIDLIEERLEKFDLKGLEGLFFNFQVEGCRNWTNQEQLDREQAAYGKFLRLTSKIIDFGGLSPDAA